MIRIDIKPLSVNACYNSQRTRSKAYNTFAKELGYKLPGGLIFDAEQLKLVVTFGFSSKGADLDNSLKALQDVLSGKYNFNDNRIYEIHAFKTIVPKGLEFIEINILPLY